MTRVRRLLAAARDVYARREGLASAVANSTGLTRAGALFGFDYLERDASDTELSSLVEAAGRARHVHVIMSANVFTAPLRALALARAASEHVTIRPSSRDPVLTRALVEAARDDEITIVEQREVETSTSDCIHVYGRSETVQAVRASAPRGATVRAHGPGMGVAVVTRTTGPDQAAEALAKDVVAFDQRGCISPRVVFVEGDGARAERLADALDRQLEHYSGLIPRGTLSKDESAQARRWMDAACFAGRLWSGSQHGVGLTQPTAPLAIPPPGRHVQVAALGSLEKLAAKLASSVRFVVAVSTNEAARVAPLVPLHVRILPLGSMQRVPLDGPVDQRPTFFTTAR